MVRPGNSDIAQPFWSHRLRLESLSLHRVAGDLPLSLSERQFLIGQVGVMSRLEPGHGLAYREIPGQGYRDCH